MLSKIVQESKRKLSEDIGEFQRERITCEQLDYGIYESFISILEAELERKKGMMKKIYDNWATTHDRDEERFTKLTKEEKGYNQAIQEDIDYLEGEITKIKSL